MAEPPSAVPPSRRGPVARGAWAQVPALARVAARLRSPVLVDEKIAVRLRDCAGRIVPFRVRSCGVDVCRFVVRRSSSVDGRRGQSGHESRRACRFGCDAPLALPCVIRVNVNTETPYTTTRRNKHTRPYRGLHHRRRVAVRVAHHPRARRARGEVDVLGHLHAQPGARVRRVGGGDDGGAQALADLVDLGPEAAER